MSTPKPLAKMTFEEFIDWAAGYLLVGIGRGEFRSSLIAVVNTYSNYLAEQVPQRRPSTCKVGR